jgi:hypothetical protein
MTFRRPYYSGPALVEVIFTSGYSVIQAIMLLGYPLLTLLMSHPIPPPFRPVIDALPRYSGHSVVEAAFLSCPRYI